MRRTDGHVQSCNVRECVSDETKKAKRYRLAKDILICLILLLVLVIEILFMRELVHAYQWQRVERQLEKIPITQLVK